MHFEKRNITSYTEQKSKQNDIQMKLQPNNKKKKMINLFLENEMTTIKKPKIIHNVA